MEIGAGALDNSLHKTSLWLDELMERMGWDDRERAYAGLRAVLHALRDRLIVDEAFDLAAELPLILRGVYFEGWDRGRCPTSERTKEEFLARVSERLMPGRAVDPERVTREVFELVARHVSGGETNHIVAMLPEPVRELWGRPARAAAKRRPSERRAVIRRAKRRIAEILAQARAEGAEPDELPLMVSKRELGARRSKRVT